MKRVVIVLFVLCTLAPPARAGQYEVHGCRTSGGAPLPAVGWLGLYGPGPWFASDNTCARRGALNAGLTRVPGYRHPQGARSQWRFGAPAGTSIRRVRGLVAMRTGPGQPYASPVAWGSADDGQGRFGIASSAALGSLTDPAAAANRFDTGIMTATGAYTLAAQCAGGGGACAPGGVAEPFVAMVRVFRTQVTLEDLAAPTLSAPAAGRLIEPGVHRHAEGVSLVAADRGSGVRRIVLELGGEQRAALVPDENTGQCRDLEPASTARDYAVPVPCAPEISGSVVLDTRTLPEGRHVLRLLVEDAAGNRRVAAGPVSPWIVDNVRDPATPPQPPGPAPRGPAPPGAGPPRGAPTPAPPADSVRARVELWFVTLSRRRLCRRAIASRSCRRLPVRFAKRRGAALTQRYGRFLRLGGRVELADGSPVAGARIVVSRRTRGAALGSGRAAARSERAAARTDAHGRFSFRLGRAASERIQVAWTPAGGSAAQVSRTLTRRVRSGLALRLRGGSAPALVGVLHGGTRPPFGVPVVAEAWTRRGWSVFARTRVRPGRRTLTLPARLPHGRWRVRLRALAVPGWPYYEGTSRSLRLAVP